METKPHLVNHNLTPRAPKAVGQPVLIQIAMGGKTFLVPTELAPTIVKAINCHDELYQRLLNIEAELCRNEPPTHLKALWRKLHADAQAGIAMAEGR